jgi:hypothetical protein
MGITTNDKCTPIIVTTLAAALGVGAFGCADNSTFEQDEQVRSAVTAGIAPPPPNPFSWLDFDASTGTVTITGTDQADVAAVVPQSSPVVGVYVSLGSIGQAFATGLVNKIVFNGGAGDDTFTNKTSIPCVANGGDGDDVLTGGSGDDTLLGGNGADTLYGGSGDDLLKGQNGNDELHGGPGRDTLYGGTGSNKLYGDDGMDLLVSVNGNFDTLTGGNQWDNFWIDANDVDTITDASSNEINLGYVHGIDTFDGVSFDGGQTFTAVGKQLGGPDLFDPIPDLFVESATVSLSLVNFASADHPLFGPGGPSEFDIFQGHGDDCYLLAALSANAKTNPEAIRRLVTDLGDGTFAVRFYRPGESKPHYVRVDADLWMRVSSVDGSQKPLYANFAESGAIWVPVVEKAFALFRRQLGTYVSIKYSDAKFPDQLHAQKPPGYTIPDADFTPQDVVAWDQAGRPAGAIADEIQAGVTAFLTWIETQQDAGLPMETTAFRNVSASTALDPATNYRSGDHEYTVDGVDTSSSPPTLLLRNPFGDPEPFTDPVQIYFLIGHANVIQMM